MLLCSLGDIKTSIERPLQDDLRGVFVEEQQYLTVKQFAKRAGVSTQRIYQLLTKSLQEFTKTENGIKYISVEGLKVFDKGSSQEVAKDLQSDLQGVASPETVLWKETIEALRQQLAVKDEQLAAKDKQIGDLTSALVSAQEQHKALTDALTAAQALHAGTIQERLTAQADSTEGHSDVPTAEVVSAHDEEETVQEQKGFFARIFGKKDRRK